MQILQYGQSNFVVMKMLLHKGIYLFYKKTLLKSSLKLIGWGERDLSFESLPVYTTTYNDNLLDLRFVSLSKKKRKLRFKPLRPRS